MHEDVEDGGVRSISSAGETPPVCGTFFSSRASPTWVMPIDSHDWIILSRGHLPICKHGRHCRHQGFACRDGLTYSPTSTESGVDVIAIRAE